jgi:hypothetical protein
MKNPTRNAALEEAMKERRWSRSDLQRRILKCTGREVSWQAITHWVRGSRVPGSKNQSTVVFTLNSHSAAPRVQREDLWQVKEKP